MNCATFWEIVEKYPWIPWVTEAGENMRSPDFLDDPSLIGRILSPSNIESRIDYITLHPLSSLNLKLKGNASFSRLHTQDRSVTLECGHEVTIYSHSSGPPLSEVTIVRNGVTVKNALHLIRAHSKLDAVVISTWANRTSGKLVNTSNPLRALVEILNDKTSRDDFRIGYEIYHTDFNE